MGGGGRWTSLTSGGRTIGRRPICESRGEEVLNVLALANKMARSVGLLLRQSARRSVRVSIMYLTMMYIFNCLMYRMQKLGNYVR